jgi:hypothetical protein
VICDVPTKVIGLAMDSKIDAGEAQKKKQWQPPRRHC